MKRLRVNEVDSNGSRLMPTLLGDAQVQHGGVYVFESGETAHPEARHVHDTDEVFIVIQGTGVLPVDGTDHPIRAGDVVIVEAGEDHHTRSSAEDPLAVAWYVLDR